MLKQSNIRKLYQQKYLDSFNIDHTITLQHQSINQFSSTDSLFNTNAFINQSQLVVRNPETNDLSTLQSYSFQNSKKNSFNCPTIPNLSYVCDNMKKPILFPKGMIVGKNKKATKKQTQKQGDGKGLMNIKNNSLHTLSQKDKELGNLKQILTRNRSELKNKQFYQHSKNQHWGEHEILSFSKYKQKPTKNVIIRQHSSIKEKYYIITGIQRKRENRAFARASINKNRDSPQGQSKGYHKGQSREYNKVYNREYNKGQNRGNTQEVKKRIAKNMVGDNEEQIEIKPWKYDVQQM